MKEEVVYIEDPLGHCVCMAKDLCAMDAGQFDEKDFYDDLFSVIKKPALLIKIEIPAELNYFRSIGWQLSVLIKVRLIRNAWKAYECILNPSDNDIVNLMRTGRQII